MTIYALVWSRLGQRYVLDVDDQDTAIHSAMRLAEQGRDNVAILAAVEPPEWWQGHEDVARERLYPARMKGQHG